MDCWRKCCWFGFYLAKLLFHVHSGALWYTAKNIPYSTHLVCLVKQTYVWWKLGFMLFFKCQCLVGGVFHGSKECSTGDGFRKSLDPGE